MTDARPHLALLTGQLAHDRLARLMDEMGREAFDWTIIDIGVKVAALMTEKIILRRLSLPDGITGVVLPGRCRADLESLSSHFGVPFERGPDEIIDLPVYFGRGGREPDLSQHDLRIFAEITEAPELSVDAILAKAEQLRAAGGDVIDIGGLPDMPFPHLADTVKALKSAGFLVSVDSANLDELLTGARAGCDFLLSLNEETVHHARDIDAVPVLVPATSGDLESLCRAAEKMEAWGLPYMADPILDPIHFGFAASLARYVEFRRRFPETEMLMGTGNLTELTEADTSGITATLLGVCSELSIRNVLVVQVSPHTRRTIEEHDAARRIMFAARRDHALPKGYGGALCSLHERKPYANTPEGVEVSAKAVRDQNFRIEVAEDGIHIYNRDLHVTDTDAFEFFPHLGVENDGGHAFYLGAELARAEIAFGLGKRYAQDNPLDWGAAMDRKEEDVTRLQEAGHTLKGKQRPTPNSPRPDASGEEPS
ncbi:dihydropteroate synthase-related protein [Hartmannibacter diazotrophicus]|uniref:Dihydropteroate synthase-related protein n=1 Tax=Hartmannibacter diazotrophicus TaxID=1482074 RepID=A0A2C9D6B5_9HYPH|nr:DUF6513 domain-containing protein [Hartmannibacter diazotrophicus]SON55836.1 dihydropteroate synthase-related protein [Hartmannibacter diazotrophicus]